MPTVWVMVKLSCCRSPLWQSHAPLPPNDTTQTYAVLMRAGTIFPPVNVIMWDDAAATALSMAAIVRPQACLAASPSLR